MIASHSYVVLYLTVFFWRHLLPKTVQEAVDSQLPSSLLPAPTPSLFLKEVCMTLRKPDRSQPQDGE